MPGWLAWSAGIAAAAVAGAAFLAWGRDGAILILDMIAVYCA